MKHTAICGLAVAAILALAAGGAADAATLKQRSKGSAQGKGWENRVQVQSLSTGVSPGGKARGALAAPSSGKQTRSGGHQSYGSYRLVFPTTKSNARNAGGKLTGTRRPQGASARE